MPDAQTEPKDSGPAEQRAARPLAPGLYVVATPIGNLGDVTLRAAEALKSCDLVLAEDTRVTAKLMARIGAATRLEAFHAHNEAAREAAILARLEGGAAICLVSDAGTPLVSDPGFALVRAAIAAGHRVVPLPGPSAVLAALVASGLPSDRFLFAGFLPPKPAARRRALGELGRVRATLVLFEGPSRIAASLADMAEILGPARPAALARELTKLHEEVRRGTLGELAAALGGEAAPKGELVVVIGPPADEPGEMDEGAIDAALDEALARGLGVRRAADEIALRFRLGRREAYARALARADGAS